MGVRAAEMPKTARSVQGGGGEGRPSSLERTRTQPSLCFPQDSYPTRAGPAISGQPARLRPSHAPHSVTLIGVDLRIRLRSDQPLWRSPSGSPFCPTEGERNLSWSLWSRCQ
jgi:hypothetical protein